MTAFRNILAIQALALIFCGPARAGDEASGNVTMNTAKTVIRHAWMVRARDEMDAQRTILRVYLSSVDIGQDIKACKTLSCADSALQDGAMVDYGDASHLGYAVRLNGGKVQYSGGTDADAFTLTTQASDRLAGKLLSDDSGRGGARVEATFDVAVSNHFDDTP